jgi:hypothetical protein
MAVFADALDLRTAVAELMKDATWTDIFPRMVIMAELRINRTARHRNMITSATVTFADGVAPLPADFIEPLHLYTSTGDSEMLQAPLSTVKASGTQYRYYAIDGDNLVVYGLDGDRTLEYWATIPTISAALTDTSWVLTQYPDVYLYTVATEAANYLQNADKAAAMDAAAERALAAMKAESDRARFARAVVVPKGVNP